MLKRTENPLLFDKHEPNADVNAIKSKAIHQRELRTNRREIRDLRRRQTAAEALEGFDKGIEIYGFTKGQFSIIDVITHALTITGPARLRISTWTAANTDVTTVLDFVNDGTLTAARWLVDLTFQRRSPELAHRIREVFGADSIRVAQNHSKFFLLDNDDWQIVCRTSMNLNFNPRFENFQIAHDPEMWEFHDEIFQEIWRKQKRGQANERPYETHKHFRDDL